LARGRQLLRKRLVRRGVQVSSASLLGLLSDQSQGAAPPRLTSAAIALAASVQSDAVISIGVQILSQGVLKAMFLKKLKVSSIALLVVAVTSGLTTLAPRQNAAEAQPPQLNKLEPPKTEQGRPVVGYIYGDEPITRDELADYVIARCGSKYLDSFINQRII